MAKPDLKKIKQGFQETLSNVWEKFDEVKSNEPEEMKEYPDPFSSTFWVDFSGMDDEARVGVSYDIGWLEGVSAVTGWSLRRAGPREWSPRG